MKRIFIEVAPGNKYNKPSLDHSLYTAIDLAIPDATKKQAKDFFWKVITEARVEPKLFDFIKEADEIHMDTSIVPLVTYTSVGSPDLWNTMMKLAIEQNITGKGVFNQRQYKQIEWGNLDKKLLSKAFVKNKLYVISDDYEKWDLVDVKKLLKEKHW